MNFFHIFSVASLATVEVYAAIPAGFAFGLHPLMIFASSVFGGLVGVFVAAFLGDRIRAFFKRNKPVKEEKPKNGLAHKLWEKYGIIGLGFLGTMTVGAPISLAVGVGFNAPLKKLVTWCCVGVLVRCAVFTAIGHYGLKMI
ncbi:MAG TPA: small multi-drug export protein [Ferruginibacter sp.]|nr:small multi-drug export protein [Ferruginibacter sp.]HRE64626.1 small multi-drug export protein [Ferruginibacter sp.]